MSFLDIASAAAAAKPIDTVPAGEYKVEIVYAKLDTDKGYAMFIMELPEVISAKSVTLMLNLPGSGRTEKEENQNINKLVDFYNCFNLNVSKQYADDANYPEGFVGASGWVLLGDPKDDGKGYGEQNKVVKFVQSSR
jgi:hypothetical protein